ncbi:DUF5720 domain-containing protein, partial [Dysosmobacter welbionis]
RFFPFRSALRSKPYSVPSLRKVKTEQLKLALERCQLAVGEARLADFIKKLFHAGIVSPVPGEDALVLVPVQARLSAAAAIPALFKVARFDLIDQPVGVSVGIRG